MELSPMLPNEVIRTLVCTGSCISSSADWLAALRKVARKHYDMQPQPGDYVRVMRTIGFLMRAISCADRQRALFKAEVRDDARKHERCSCCLWAVRSDVA